MSNRTVTIAVTFTALSVAAVGWLGCAKILGDFDDGPGGVDGAVTDVGPIQDQMTTDVVVDATSNCTMTGTCAPGYPCSSATQCATGMCTMGTCSAPDCAADASCALGTTCENGGSCGSGNCVDGVCCGMSDCPACTNCGSTGMCSDSIKGMDDLSATSCTGNSTCNSTGACVQRWVNLGMSNTVGYFSSAYTTAAGNNLYFAYTNAFVSFDVTTNMFATQPHDAGMCWCGYPGPLAASATELFMLYDSTLDVWTPGQSAWTTLISTEPGNFDGSALAVIGGKVYAMGGNYSSATASAWSTPVGGTTWTAIAPMPTALAGACAGVDATNGKIYVFGGQTSQSNTTTYIYTVSTNTWATGPAGTAPYCSYTTVPTWNGSLAYADYNGIHLYDLTAQTWGTTLPLPTGVSLQAPTALVPGDGHLYLVGYDGTNDQVYRWNLN